MPSFNYRVFLSYRGISVGDPIGKDFSYNLYNYLKHDPFCDERFGEIYYSPITKGVEVNYKKDVQAIMSTVEYFVMPLTKDYFEGFWDNENNCPNYDSITYIEIQAAIESRCRFICIKFPEFIVDTELIKKLFGKNSDDLLCVEPLEYSQGNEEFIFQKISEVLKKQKTRGMSTFLKDLTPNVFLSFKEETEDNTKYPFYEKLSDVTKITLLNFAASSFISGVDIASTYKKSDTLKSWFNHNLINGNIETDIILVNPHSYAAHDAALYKMFPSGLTTDKNDIILSNMNKLFEFMRKYPNAKLNVYLTNIALPYGIMITEHTDKSNNHIKVDLYSSVINDDKMRPSFYLLQSDPKTKMLFSFFEDNVRNIMNNYSFKYMGHPDTKWLLNKNIIHRGKINSHVLPHTQEAYDACIDAKYPIEVDLLLLSDETVVVGRKEEILLCAGEEKQLGDCTIRDLRIHNKAAGNKRIFTLEDFLIYINGKIPVLLEIKSNHSRDTNSNNYVRKILKIVRNHLKYDLSKIAFHSSDPYILKIIKDIDCMIPCGLISMDFSKIESEVGEEFCRLHKENSYLQFLSPDFISYNIYDLESNIKYLCEEYNIPLLAWTIKDDDAQQQAIDYGCDNIIIEGSKTYL